MREAVWLDAELVIAIHDRQLKEFGGPAGIRDKGMLESALDRPRNKWAYENADLPHIAAAYAYGIARNHPFVDGNKRAALLAITVFLAFNGIEFEVEEPEFAAVILALAAGELSEENLARWIRDHLPPDARSA